jgi:hypothetical protein
VTFVVAAALIALVRRPMNAVRTGEPRRVRPIGDTREAFHYASSNRPLTLLLCSKAGLGLAGGVVPLLAVFGKEVFDAGDAGIGLLLGARGLGAVIGPMVAQRRLSSHGATTSEQAVPGILLLCGAGAVVYGVGYLGVASAPSLALAMVATFVAHLGGGAQWMLSNLGLQLATPDPLRGRIFAADFAVLTVTMSCSFVISGWLSGRVGPRPVTAVLAVIACTWGLLYLTVTRGLRRPEVAQAPLPP